MLSFILLYFFPFLMSSSAECCLMLELLNPFLPQRQLRKRKCYLLVAGAIILTILIIVIAVSARK